MAEENNADNAGAAELWRCDYCGANRNAQSETQCGICGSRRNDQLPGFLRRAGRSAASRLLANYGGMPRGDFDEMFEDGLEIQFREGLMGMDDEEQVAALAMEVAGAARIPGVMSRRIRRLQGGPEQQEGGGGSSDGPAQPAEPPETLWRLAMDNASSYQPRWTTSTQHRGRMRQGHDIEIGSGDLQNVARIEDGVTEGRAVRASDPLPRAAHRSQRDHGDQPTRKLYGFRVVFDHPFRDPGMSLGDCYLIGLTTSSFSAFGDRNGLMSSPHFWGIEDGGSFFEGARRRRGGRPGGGSSAGYGNETSSRDAPRNADGVLFGSQETVTVVVDLENSTMSFWRDGDFIGTLVRNLPRSGYLYPVVVPFNSGVTFAITGMDGSPLPCVKNFNALRKQKLEQQASLRRQELTEQRSILIRDGQLSPAVIKILKKIFFSYAGRSEDSPPSEPLLDILTASRLWYRCGLVLSELGMLADEKAAAAEGAVRDIGISFDEFIECVKSVIEDEEAVFVDSLEEGPPSYEVGDKVELVDSYSKFGDASAGPLQPGDRGTILEVKEGPGGEICAINVSFNADQWWYQPHALLTERSGLIESPSVWFLHRALRTHGYDQTTLEPLWGKSLSNTSWEVGDIVVPFVSETQEGDTRLTSASLVNAHDCFGRIVSEARDSGSSMRPRGRKADSVLVEFIDPAFGIAVGVMNALDDDSEPVVEVRRVPIAKLQHGEGGSGQCHFKRDFKKDSGAVDEVMVDAELKAKLSRLDSEMEIAGTTDKLHGSSSVVVSSRLRAEIEGISCLDPTSIQSVAKTCEKQPSVCSNAFASGLCDAILSAVSLAEENAKKGNVNDRMGVALSSLGLLSSILCKSLLSVNEESPSSSEEDSEMCEDDEDLNLSSVFAEASLPLNYPMPPEVPPTNASARREPLDAVSLGRMAARARGGPLFRARARHTNSSSTRSARDEWNMNGDKHVDTRVAICNGLLRNSLPWLEACLRLPEDKDESKLKAGAESYLSKMTNARDEHGMSLLLLAITVGCSKEIVNRLILSEANVTKTEITAAAVSNQPHLLSLLLEHSSCPRHVVESLNVSDEVAEVFKTAESRRKIHERALRQKAEAFASSLIVSLCRLEDACRSRIPRIQRFGKCSTQALVGNVLLRALNENQCKALATASPRRRKHGSDLMPDADSERLSLSLGTPFATTDSDVFASASAMSAHHGILLGLPEGFFSVSLEDFSDQSNPDRQELLTAILSLTEKLLWSNDQDSVAAGLTILHVLLKGTPLADLSCEIERYGLRELMSAHELIAGRRLAEIKSRLSNANSQTGTEATTDGSSRSNKKRSRQHLASNTSSADEGVVVCPKSHIAELHLTRHSSFRCDLCGKGVLRDRPMHGCRECDWDACETCTNQSEGGIVKWGHIQELAMSCSKLLDPSEGKASAGSDSMKIDESFDDARKATALPDFSSLAKQLRARDTSALEELSFLLESSDRMTNHEFVTFILPALHSSLVDTHGLNTIGIDQFSSRALDAFTDVAESSNEEEPREDDDDDSQMSVEELPSQGDERSSGRFETYGQVPKNLANRVPSIGLRRMQDILSFSENMQVLHVLWDQKRSGVSSSLNGSRLKSLAKPIELTLSPWSLNVGSLPEGFQGTTVYAEPLVPSKELERHVLRAGKIENDSYLSFCRSLAAGGTVIFEREMQATPDDSCPWRIAQVTGFDETSGAHSVIYPLKVPSHRRGLGPVPFESLKFDGEKAKLVLAARDYVIVRRTEHKSPSRRSRSSKPAASRLLCGVDDLSAAFPPSAVPCGVRVESNCSSPDHSSWFPCSVLSRCMYRNEMRYEIVFDSGEIFQDVREDQIRGYRSSSPSAEGSGRNNEAYRNLRDSLDSDPMRNALRRSGAMPFPFFRMGRNAPDQRTGESRSESRPSPESSILKRSWSAISPINEMSPLNISLADSSQREVVSTSGSDSMTWKCCIGGEAVEISVSESYAEAPPKLSVEFTAHDALPPEGVCSAETVIHMLHRLLQRKDETRNDGGLLRKKHQLYYNVHCDTDEKGDTKADAFARSSRKVQPASLSSDSCSGKSVKPDARRKTFAQESFDTELFGVSESLDSTSLQCMEILNVLAGYTEEAGVNFRQERVDPNDDSLDRLDRGTSLLSSFENDSLSQKLQDQLEDPLMVVSGVLPEWCLTAPSLAPRVFSYAARRELLLRTAFGVSRSTLKQQEAKVAVGPLRQRMAVLRGRAVELMGEAFSGQAEDPTVLQLQADELYGMEEALASRVTASFRAQRWEEHSLQVAKAVVRRETLLIDATNLMERYASDEKMCHRRLEVRFEGESGFDAASGTEAGVTRGFYADVAEALLSSDHVSPLNCPITCFEASKRSFGEARLKDALFTSEVLPLWIPDMDSSHQVVIPTPRASPNSTLGVYPRPLLPYDSMIHLVKERFRFMGRLFAAAMRDGLMFPLQLSTSFLKLVQLSVSDGSPSAAVASAISNNIGGASVSAKSGFITLNSDDLPRPGFLGGEIYAVENHICASLDAIELLDLSPMELIEEKEAIATDPQFARVALGKSYDCSFEDYFEDRVFVDPLSPTQGEDAARLCHNGHLRPVTIDNVREYVRLAKQFILHDGVIEQARAFRQGIDDFFSSDYLRIFTAIELQRDVCGGGDKVDRWTESDIRDLFKFDGGRGVTEALVAVAAMGGEGGASLNRRFGPSSPTIGFLVRTLLESTPTQRRQFLSFVTSVPIVTPGKIEVAPMVSPSGEFLPLGEGCLPRANTCARRLYLPRFDNYETFNRVLHSVIREESKFKGFYEWRG